MAEGPSFWRRRNRLPGRVLGVVLLLVGVVGWLVITHSGMVPASERLQFADLDLVISLLGFTSLLVLPRLWADPECGNRARLTEAEAASVHVTEDLLVVLLEQAARSEPAGIGVGMAVTSAGRFEGETGLSSTTPVFTHLVPPYATGSTSAVFGVDIGVPPRETQGRFVSHPDCDPTLSKRDTLHEVVFVAIPPWDRKSVAAYDRSGRRLSITCVDEPPPEERLPELVDKTAGTVPDQ